MTSSDTPSSNDAWYAGVTRSMWLVLAVASAGWIFDVYEGQIFNLTRNHMLGDILNRPADSPEVKKYGDFFLAVFLAGGTIGGLGFGFLADRFGRRPIMVITILMYSLFSGLTYFASELWQVAALRFLVATGVGGEWAVAASLVSEVFPTKARAHASAIFHASSVLGTWMAAIVAMAVQENWPVAYLIGVLPALLILWVRSSVKETEQWEERRLKTDAPPMGYVPDLIKHPTWRRHALLGIALAAVGLGTFWAVTVAGQDLARERLIADGVSKPEAATKAQFAYGILQTAGGGLGLLAFGPLAARFGRRLTFMLFQFAALIIVPITCFVPQTYNQLLVLLPIFGFLTLGIHAGYAVYFPELFPTHLRATGTSFCFNGGRMVAVPILLLSGKLKERTDVDLRWAMTALASLFLLGIVFAALLPETRNQKLPD
jgi:MFS family permease